MPSNIDLKEQIAGIDPDAAVENLNNAQLIKKLYDVKAEAEKPDELEDESDELEDESEPVKLAPYTVAKGKSVTSKKGILGEGEEIKAEYLGGKEEALRALVKARVVSKNS